MNLRLPTSPAVVTVFAAICFTTVGFDALHSTGESGTTRKNGDGCSCHGDHLPTDTVFVWVEGPDTVRLGTLATYTLLMRGGPSVAGGFNVATSSGTLSPSNAESRVLNSELTHSGPKDFVNDTVRWQFVYHAPDSGSADTLYSVGNSVNLNGQPTGDQFNFGRDFIIQLRDTTTDVSDQLTPQEFWLAQNYPNPFNPETKIRFRLPGGGHRSGKQDEGSIAVGEGMVTLIIYDLQGKEVTTLVNQVKQPGEYIISWDASGYSGGIYFYELRTSQHRQVRKMALIR